MSKEDKKEVGSSMAYKRQIAYLDLIENGQKKRNAGFCKWEYRGECHILSVSVSGLSGIISGELVVYTGAGNRLGDLKLYNGRAQEVYRLKSSDMGQNAEFDRIRIPLSQGRELSAEFQKSEELRDTEVNRILEEIQMTEKKQPQEEPHAPEGLQQLREEPYVTEELHQPPEADTSVINRPIPQSIWESLASTHERMHPFGTETEYYRITLEDIYRLKEECHMLRNNPFLLHGYYNYRYLILGKKERSESEFWLGVPGIYHEREKMAARMYGFEKFEGTKPGYRIGDLGYYLISAM